MTTATAQLCGHRWLEEEGIPGHHDRRHRCDEPADHPLPCACRCGTTTTRKDER